MRFRKLRIAWSVFWGLACGLLVVLWVRSYRVVDAFSRGEDSPSERSKVMMFFSGGVFTFDRRTYPPSKPEDIGCNPVILANKWVHSSWEEKSVPWRYFEWKHGPDPNSAITFVTTLTLPMWLLAIPFVLATAAPWTLRLKRFSLRTLLIATTLVAVVLGLVVYATRKH